MSGTPAGSVGRLVVGVPLLGVLFVVAYVLVETVRPGTMAAPVLETVPEAIAAGHPARALELLADGADINQPARVRAGVVRPGRAAYDVTPLEAAVLVQRSEAVRLLLRSGADPARSPMAICLARYRLPEVLVLFGAQPDATGQALPEVLPEAAVRACGGRVVA